MYELAQNWTSINVMKHMVVIVGLVRKPLVIQKRHFVSAYIAWLLVQPESEFPLLRMPCYKLSLF
jgi:hypothetical protein